MFDLIASVLTFFYDQVWSSYGMSLVFLTLAVMILATPLTLKSTKSMLMMQRLQPELKSIQAKHKDDRAKMNEELMAFYQANGINPLGGCLPMLVQLPIFLVLFRVVQGVVRRASDVGNQIGWSAGRIGSGQINTVTPFGRSERPFDPTNLAEDSEMYQRLVGVDSSTGARLPFDERPTEMVSWTIDLSRSAQDVLGDSFLTAIPYLALIVIVLVSSLYQQRQIQGRTTGSQINPQQQMIMKVLPYMLPVFSFTMPAALVVYFVVSNMYRIGQQAYITRSLYSGDESPGAMLAKQRASDKKSGSTSTSDNGSSSTAKKGAPTPKRNEKGRKSSSKKSGAGRTGKAPSRQHRGSGRTTEPGSPQNRKRKK